MRRFLAALALLSVGACNSAGGFPPQAGNVASTAHARPNVLLCLVPIVGKPGLYASFAAGGEIRNGAFTVTGNALWTQWKVTAGAGPAPFRAPRHATYDAYVYSGTYALKKGGRGCVDLYAWFVRRGVWGSIANGYPIFAPNVKATVEVKDLPAKIVVAGLTPKGEGSGTITLFNKLGRTYDSGTITITRRIPVIP